jgi:hypothetical protein
LAGLGRKEFNSGDILLASEVQGYLQDQAVMVFDDATARGSAIASPSEGMVTYTKDDDAIQVYDGSAFVGVGSDAGLIHINTTDSGGAVSSLSLDDVFSSTYKNYRIIISDIIGSTTLNLTMRFRFSGSDNSTSNYNYQSMGANATTVSGARTTSQTSINLGGVDTNATVVILDVFEPFVSKVTDVFDTHLFKPASTLNQLRFLSAGFAQTNSFDGFSLIPSTGTITIGNVSVYGYK